MTSFWLKMRKWLAINQLCYTVFISGAADVGEGYGPWSHAVRGVLRYAPFLQFGVLRLLMKR